MLLQKNKQKKSWPFYFYLNNLFFCTLKSLSVHKNKHNKHTIKIKNYLFKNRWSVRL